MIACNNHLAWNSYVMIVFLAAVCRQVSECIEMLRLGLLWGTDVQIPGHQIVEFCSLLNHC